MTLVPATLGDCSFCGHVAVDTWPTTVWEDDFTRLVDAYRLAEPTEGGIPLVDRLQDDWAIFSFDRGRAQAFLSSVFAGSNPLVEGSPPVLPAFEDEGPGADKSAQWQLFVEDITSSNRFFPKASFDLEGLGELILSRMTNLPQGSTLYRARNSQQGTRYVASKMGAPPHDSARAGRANSAGIPALYLSFDEATALKEVRAVQHGYVTLATFASTRALDYLDLAADERENVFNLSTDILPALSSSRLLKRLDFELARPMRSADTQLEYVPTQYFCDYVKSIGVEAIRFRSSMSRSSTNLVAFEASLFKARQRTKLVEVTDIDLKFVTA